MNVGRSAAASLAAAIIATSMVGIGALAGAEEEPRQNVPQADQRQEQDREQRAQQQQREQQDRARNAQQQDVRPQGRLSEDRQRQLIVRQQQRLSQYRQHLEGQQRQAQQQSEQLQHDRRTAQYRFQQQYAARLRKQQTQFETRRAAYDYDRDPYFHTPPSYRYRRGDIYYETNQYGADSLRHAVNYGYEEGLRSGQADREDNWKSSYRDSSAYQDANYGYDGYYVDRDDYNYYFREGFRRGYDDGYESRHQYGSNSDGSYSVLGDVLSSILDLQPLGN